MFEALLGTDGVPFEARSVGQPLSRVDGWLKVTGAARYTAEHRPDGLVHGVVIGSAVARGRVAAVDAAEAEGLPGVVAVFTPANAPKLKPLPDKVQGIQYSGEGGLIEMLLPMQDDRVHYAGQAVVLVVAESFEQATFAAAQLRVTYDEEAPELDLDTATRRAKPESYCGMEPLRCPSVTRTRRMTQRTFGWSGTAKRPSTPTARSKPCAPSRNGGTAMTQAS